MPLDEPWAAHYAYGGREGIHKRARLIAIFDHHGDFNRQKQGVVEQR